MAEVLISELAQATGQNADGSDRQEILALCRAGDELHLVPQTDNLYDTHVVRVCREDMQQLGCLDIDVKYQVFAALTDGKPVACCIERLTGPSDAQPIRGASLALHIPGANKRQAGCLAAALVLLAGLACLGLTLVMGLHQNL